MTTSPRSPTQIKDGEHFYDWAQGKWPAPRYRVCLDAPPLKPWSY